jgi:hypothetical protein
VAYAIWNPECELYASNTSRGYWPDHLRRLCLKVSVLPHKGSQFFCGFRLAKHPLSVAQLNWALLPDASVAFLLFPPGTAWIAFPQNGNAIS